MARNSSKNTFKTLLNRKFSFKKKVLIFFSTKIMDNLRKKYLSFNKRQIFNYFSQKVRKV